MDDYVITYVYNERREERLIDIDKYSYIDMLNDIYNSVLDHVPEGLSLRFQIKEVANGGRETEVKGDTDLVCLFAKHTLGDNIVLVVYNVDLAGHPSPIYTINGYPSSIICRESQIGRHWIFSPPTSLCNVQSSTNSNVRIATTSDANLRPTTIARAIIAPVKRGGATERCSSRITTNVDICGQGISDISNHGIDSTMGDYTVEEPFGFDESSDEEWKDGSDSGNEDSSDDDLNAYEDEGDDDNNDELSDFENEDDLFLTSEDVHDEGKVKLAVGQVFGDIHLFRNALRDYVIQENVEICRIKNEKDRVTAICAAPGCQWRIHATPTADHRTFMIKSLHPIHTCVKVAKNSNATSTWIAGKLSSQLKADPNLSYESMKAILQERYGIVPHPMQLYRARKIAKIQNEGNHAKSYAWLPRYGEVVTEKNPGSVFKLQFEKRFDLRMNPQFKRMFICFDACIKGFVNGCRPFIGLDGCHLKGRYGGVLLAAVSIDGNNGLFPVAFGVVEVECKDSWVFFLQQLYCSLFKVTDDMSITFMSDKQKGLAEAITDTFPYAYQRHCCRHLYNNFKVHFPGLLFRNAFWLACKATTNEVYKKAMKSMENLDKEAHDWLVKNHPSLWSRHAFDIRAKSEHITNNMTESFNSWINPFRGMPILSLIDEIRKKLMGRFQRRYEKACSYKSKITPRMIKRLDSVQLGSRSCQALSAGHNEFEVTDGTGTWLVNLNTRSCTCKVWEISGIPCKHAAAGSTYKREHLEDLCDYYFTVEKYLKAYEGMIHPMPDVTMEDPPSQTGSEVQPPTLHRRPGRPRRNRRREPDEAPSADFRKQAGSVRCDICKLVGHNKRTCQKAPTKRQVSASQKQSDVQTRKRARGKNSATEQQVLATQESFIVRGMREHGQDDINTSQVITRSQASTAVASQTKLDKQREKMAAKLARKRSKTAG